MNIYSYFFSIVELQQTDQDHKNMTSMQVIGLWFLSNLVHQFKECKNNTRSKEGASEQVLSEEGFSIIFMSRMAATSSSTL